MANVYSTKFLEAASFTGGPVTGFVVPAGFRAVVKTMTIVWGNIVVSGLDAWFQTGGLTKLCRVTYAAGLSITPNIGGDLLRYGTWVLNPGDELQIQTVAGTVDFMASGYLLSLP